MAENWVWWVDIDVGTERRYYVILTEFLVNTSKAVLWFPVNFLSLIWIKCVPRDQSNIFLATIFTKKMPESSGSMHSSILVLENICYYHFTWSGPNSQEIVDLFQFSSGPRGPAIGRKFTIPCEFGPLQAKWWCFMFSNMK